ncbi:YufK family protein [Chungangia koreensis]|uniref:YufK family protein n=1 Tax=Chungangia koreensis TaxID=752657 RepID=A0ABV8XAD6_9LACT
MKNPYVFGFMPLATIILFSLTFGLYSVTEAISFFKEIGLYAGMREFLSDFQLRVFLLIILSFSFFMVFSALKLIAETIHEFAMLFFSKDVSGEGFREARSGNVIYFVGSMLSVIGIQSLQILIGIFLITTFIYFVYVVYRMSHYMNLLSMIGMVVFEIVVWSVFIAFILYVLLKLYNGLMASLPILDENKSS